VAENATENIEITIIIIIIIIIIYRQKQALDWVRSKMTAESHCVNHLIFTSLTAYCQLFCMGVKLGRLYLGRKVG